MRKFSLSIVWLLSAILLANAQKAPADIKTSDQPLRPVMETHTVPPWPLDAWRAGKQGLTLIEVHITAKGNVDDCSIVSSSGSALLDQVACDHVIGNWRWMLPTKDGLPVATKTRVSLNWILPQPSPNVTKPAPAPASNSAKRQKGQDSLFCEQYAKNSVSGQSVQIVRPPPTSSAALGALGTLSNVLLAEGQQAQIQETAQKAYDGCMKRLGY